MWVLKSLGSSIRVLLYWEYGYNLYKKRRTRIGTVCAYFIHHFYFAMAYESEDISSPLDGEANCIA